MGAGPRIFKLGFIKVKVYSVALYVEERGAQASLAARRRDMIDSELLGAVLEGDFDKALVIRFVRNVSGKLFWGMTEMAQGLQAGMLGSVSRAAIPGRNVILRESI